MEFKDKLNRLEKIFLDLNKVAIAFSGGLDSGFLAYFSRGVLGKDNVLALTIYSPLKISMSELEEAKKITSKYDINHKILEASIPEEIRFNPPDRCYFCKRKIFGELLGVAKKEGFFYLCDGTNADDLNDYRPGIRAIKELGIKTPLLEAGFTKKDIRYWAKKFKLPFWNKPSNACLISRLPYNTEINSDTIEKIDKAESYVKSLGFKVVRVRLHGEIARVEVGENEIQRILKKKILKVIDKELKNMGFKYVALDCHGYRTGSMNG